MITRLRTVILVFLAAWALSLPTVSLAEHTSTNLDASKGDPGAYTITYVIVTIPESPQKKTVAVIVRDGDTPKLSYVYSADGDTVALGLDAEFAIPEEHSAESDCTLTIVSVSLRQSESATAIIQSHVAEADTSDSPEIQFYNCVSEVLKACDMRLPYRSPYRPPNLIQWVGDIPDYNKDLIPIR